MHGYENTIIGGVEMYLPKSWISAIERHRQSALGETVIPLSVQFTNADELRKRAEAAEKQLAEAQGRIAELEAVVRVCETFTVAVQTAVRRHMAELDQALEDLRNLKAARDGQS